MFTIIVILSNFVRKLVRKRRKMRQKYFLLPIVWILMSLLMLVSFVVLHICVEEIEVLGKVSDEHNWLRNSNLLESYVQPQIDTEILKPSNIAAIKVLPQKIACFVMSAPRNRLARSAVRRTWGKIMKPIFVIGLSDDNSTMNFIMNEAKVFDDIIVENFVDSYMNLTIKTAFAMKYFTKHFAASKYFFKIDDDVLLHVENLNEMLEDENLPKNSIIGRLGESIKPHRDRENKWYLPYWLYGDASFPSYIDGPAYIIPGHMVAHIYKASMTLPFFTLEDVFFNGFVANKTLKYNLHNNKKFRTDNVPYYDPCLHKHYITVHQTSPKIMIQLWERMRREYSCTVFDRLLSHLIYKYDL